MLSKPHQSATPWKRSVEALKSQARFGCRAATYSTSSGTKSGSSSEKQLVKQGRAQTYSTSSTPPTEGLISRSCTRYIKDQVKFHLQTHLLMQGFISKKFFANHFYNPSNSVVLRNHYGTT
jgi:hypothetical protein